MESDLLNVYRYNSIYRNRPKYLITNIWSNILRQEQSDNVTSVMHTPYLKALLSESVSISNKIYLKLVAHDDVIKWKHFPRYWPFEREIHRSPVNSPHKGQWRGALMISLICVWINGWVNNREAGDLRRYRAHFDVTVMGSLSDDTSTFVLIMAWCRQAQAITWTNVGHGPWRYTAINFES